MIIPSDMEQPFWNLLSRLGYHTWLHAVGWGVQTLFLDKWPVINCCRISAINSMESSYIKWVDKGFQPSTVWNHPISNESIKSADHSWSDHYHCKLRKCVTILLPSIDSDQTYQTDHLKSPLPPSSPNAQKKSKKYQLTRQNTLNKRKREF